jgi:hypothetical protein
MHLGRARRQGLPLYDWAFVQLDHGDGDPADQHWRLLRRNRTTGELAFCRCWMPRSTPLAILVRVAGCRWRIEEAFPGQHPPVWPG